MIFGSKGPNIIIIKRKGRDIFVIPTKVGDLDKSKCSSKFLKHNFDKNKIVNIKCDKDGKLDLRGKSKQYRIIVED